MLAPRFRNDLSTRLCCAVQCADSVNDSRVEMRNGKCRIVPLDAFGASVPCESHVPAIPIVAASSKELTRRAQIIAGSTACFERLARQVRAASMVPVYLRAIHINTSSSSTPHKRAACRDTQSQRTADGIVQSHRAAWRAVLAANRSMAILEEDSELIGDAAEVHFAIDRCERAECDLTFLGVTGDFFSSHAYWMSPRAADLLLRVTHERCNARKADHPMRSACLGRALERCLSHGGSAAICNHTELTRTSPPPLRCHKPSRVLWMRDLGSYGLFVQNHKAFTSYAWQGYNLLVAQRDKDKGRAAPKTTSGLEDRLKSQPGGVGTSETAAAQRAAQCVRKMSAAASQKRRVPWEG